MTGTVLAVRLLGPHIAHLSTVGSTHPSGEVPLQPRARFGADAGGAEAQRQGQVEAFQSIRLRPIGQTFAGAALWLLTDCLWRLLGTVARKPKPEE